MNPLFSDDSTDEERERSYLLPNSQGRRIEPSKDGAASNPAVDLIRHKIDALYANEPSARQEIADAKLVQPPRSKHQQKMHELTTSGKSLAEIQTAWHTYYIHLTDHEKREVWQEFYSANAKHATPQHAQHGAAVQNHSDSLVAPAGTKLGAAVVDGGTTRSAAPVASEPKTDRRSIAGIKKGVLKKVRASGATQTKAKQHLQSLAFGLGLGALVLLIFLFGLFNEMVIAPFIKPSSSVSATPIILPADSVAPSENPELIIPKLNVQIPVIYGGQSLAEADVQKALEEGIFHYPTTAIPGQKGNAAYFGHSSNNIFNKGKYKFAFVRLNELEPGDIFYLTYEKKVYTYKVYSKRVVEPNETWVLGPVEGKTATATLITCDPPGTTRHRLVVWGEQVSPDPNGNIAAATPSEALQTQTLPDNGPSVWSRFWRWVTPW